MWDAIAVRMERAIKEKVFPGGVIGIVRGDGVRDIVPFGNYTYEAHADPMTEDSVFDLASITKSIPTSSIALQLIHENKLKLTDRLVDILPEFNNSDRELVNIKHLLTYTIGSYGLATALHEDQRVRLADQTLGRMMEILYTHEFSERPGKSFVYSNVPAALLGLVVERITDQNLDALADLRFFEPLGMTRTTFFPERLPLQQIAPTEVDWRGKVRGVVHDESAYIAKREGKIFGHAGLFSTAGDLLTFFHMILSGGEAHAHWFFSEQTIHSMENNQIPELGQSTGLGWELAQSRFMGQYAGPHTFGKTGFTGTSCVCDRQRGVAFVILTNRTYPQRPPDDSKINELRCDIADTIFGDIH